jgi:hypothetical protein
MKQPAPPIPAGSARQAPRPLLAALPAGLWVFSLFCDLLYLGGAGTELWSRLALYAMVGGFIGAVTLLTLPGFVAQMNATLVVVALYAVNIWLRLDDAHSAMAIALSVTGVGVLAVSSWLELRVFQRRG